MKFRLALALVTLGAPTVLLADEPASMWTGVSCDQVKTDASSIMLARQFGLSFQGARLHLGKTALRETLVNAAYLAPKEAGDVKPFEAIDAFGEEWHARCLASSNKP